MQMIIFTDLDGSLLNHGDYAFANAMPSLDRIKACGIPLIMTTSKTRREVECLQEEMGIREPFIVENGGGVVFPGGYQNPLLVHSEQHQGDTVIAMGTTYERVRDFMQQVGKRFSLRGFGDMTPEEIAEFTGLPIERASMAKVREFTEPFLMERPEEIGLLNDRARQEGLRVTRGGRFHHLMGIGQDKGKAVRMVRDLFRPGAGETLKVIGLGDSENDLAMFEEVDIPVLIPRPGGGHLNVQFPGLIRATEPGAKGWNGAVWRLLNETVRPAGENS